MLSNDGIAASAVAGAVARLCADFSVEVTPREGQQLPSFREVLTVGTRVYITFLAKTPVEDAVAVAARIRAEGMRPVPHLAARSIADRAALDRLVGAFADVGVEDVLVIAGSLAHPAGGFDETLQVLSAGVLEEHGIRNVAVAGHPEGNKDIGEEGLARALAAKNALAADRGLGLYIVTQFAFAAQPIVEWERRIRLAGSTLPIHVGLPGLATPAKLLKFGLSCGIGASLKVLRKQTGGVLRLVASSSYHPDETIVGVARSVAADPASLIRSLHFFPFGSLVATAAWADDLRHRRFVLGEDSLQVTA